MDTCKKTPNRLRGVLLDFDGTVTVPFFDWTAIKSEMGIGDMLVLDAMARATPKRRGEMKKIMDRWERDAVAGAKIRNGIAEVLETLSRLEIESAIVTNNCTANVEATAGKFGLKLPPVVSRDCGYYKPLPEIMKIALGITGTLPSETVFVGDSRLDMIAGCDSGLKTVFIGDDPGGLGGVSPDYHVADAASLVSLIEELSAI